MGQSHQWGHGGFGRRGDCVAKRENMFLHQTTGLDAAGMVVVALGSRSRAMTEQTAGDADVVRIVDRNAGSGTIPEQVRVDRPAQAVAGPAQASPPASCNGGPGRDEAYWSSGV